ncbi:ComF family protein [Pelagibacterium montanilacus]|uniref:ComF family protein n=1 Tax=Pelagibacterium montanilacus TaxID=2185280 RepID=UPI000F8E908D|nr:ComF family protein [Pelagibacterium montanilacus]
MEIEGGIVKERGAGSGLVGRLGRSLLDFAFPPVCTACGEAIGGPDALCPECWRQLEPITAPLCPILGLPFAADMGAGATSPQAIANPPPFDRARAAVAYNDIARAIVARMKYSDRPEIARLCGRLMAGAGHELVGPDALLVPVPLHRGRQFLRRYNQSSELAHVIAGLANVALDTDLVWRRRNTARQVGLSARQRQTNVQGAFAVRPERAQRHRGRRIVIIDDVVTTGATVAAVAKAVQRAGFEAVDVLSFARVVFDDDMTV